MTLRLLTQSLRALVAISLLQGHVLACGTTGDQDAPISTTCTKSPGNPSKSSNTVIDLDYYQSSDNPNRAD